jgi:membrane protease YdiL (CAAX protease family)
VSLQCRVVNSLFDVNDDSLAIKQNIVSMTYNKHLKIISTTFGVPILFSLALMSVALLSLSPFFLGGNERFTYGIGGSMIALLILYAFLKIDHRSWKDYFLSVDKLTLNRFVKGSAAGLVLAAAMFLLQVWHSGLTITATGADLSRFAWMALSLVPLAFMEELAFRSYPFFKLHDTYGVWRAQISMALLFALYHYIGGWSLEASFLGPFVWSFAFGLLALVSNGIALPTGFHFGLNLALAAIGNKHWIPGLIEIDFADTPTEEMLTSNAYFGTSMHLVLFVALLLLTYRFTKKSHGERSSN